MLDPIFNDFPMITSSETPQPLTMETRGQIVTISRHDPSAVSKDLGIMLAPDGNMTEQFAMCLKNDGLSGVGWTIQKKGLEGLQSYQHFELLHCFVEPCGLVIVHFFL